MACPGLSVFRKGQGLRSAGQDVRAGTLTTTVPEWRSWVVTRPKRQAMVSGSRQNAICGRAARSKKPAAGAFPIAGFTGRIG